jgi:hypothetical protein
MGKYFNLKFCVCLFCGMRAYQMLFLAKLKETSASWNSEILQSFCVVPFK